MQRTKEYLIRKHTLCNCASQIPLKVNHTSALLVSPGVQILSPPSSSKYFKKRFFGRLEHEDRQLSSADAVWLTVDEKSQLRLFFNPDLCFAWVKMVPMFSGRMVFIPYLITHWQSESSRRSSTTLHPVLRLSNSWHPCRNRTWTEIFRKHQTHLSNP